MNSDNFNPEAWQEQEERQIASPAATLQAESSADAGNDIETITRRIEAGHIDITQGYSNWLELAFALSSELGENGRDIFHRISRFHPEYSEQAANAQYDKCLKSKGRGITIRTFFAKAKEAGIDIRTGSGKTPIPLKSPKTPGGDIGGIGDSAEPEQLDLPTFSGEVIATLPEFLQKVASVGESPQETDALILGAITVLSSCLPNVEGLYDGVTVYPNLFYFLSARASSGKGRLSLCRYLVQPIHRRLKDLHAVAMEDYQMRLSQWEAAKKDTRGPKPEKPAQTMLIIPANTSATAVYQLLAENGGKGLIFETEGDTLANAFESDFGNFSDGFRKAFHHEPISYHRRSGDEDVEIENPQLSTVLTGTPKQIVSLIKDAENGLFSRFIFYRLNSALVWKDVLADQQKDSLNCRFTALGQEFCSFYDALNASGTLRFSVTEDQRGIFNEFFSSLQTEFYGIFHDDILASVRRLGLICYRIAMILSALRIMETGDFCSEIKCLDEDFNAAISIIRVLSVHTAKIFDELTSADSVKTASVVKNAKKQHFLDALKSDFDCQDYRETADRLGIPRSTAEKWIRAFCGPDGPLEKVEHGRYHKL